ncbi:uncharacterized protein EI97DRAFT_430814 [Westerdykella ornata]|uniref:GPI anchored cell wall protein n=1 Tax=Westerdykella ornata TaxID=318751 RepID=A0A6A6JXK3_WESOR|nr:uncharacterized protein EI97DRAFT_430814 [Westerdykella ornata]KAF2279799.1 hypothetical protein EI97DRAFT_430814 [Westerdykella ornata]
MRQSIALLSVCASAVLAQAADQNQFKFFFPSGSDGVQPVANVEIVDPATTVAQIACPTGVDSTECGWGMGLEYTVISTTIYKATMKEEGRFTMSFSCNHDTAKSEVSCGVTQTGEQYTGATELVLAGSDIAFATASITGTTTTKNGQENMPTGTASTGAGASTSGAGTSASGAQASGSKTTGPAAPGNTGAAYKPGFERLALVTLAGAAVLNVL